ncbi:MAG: hypothetical protein PHQ36_01795 [Anaerolineales bacterium]|nr:hypothetical protein [Anaerolineales bacterium]
MFRISKFLFVLSIFVIFISIPVAAVHAAPVHPQDSAPVLPSLPELVQTAFSLGGVALFFTAIINAGKTVLVNGNPIIPNNAAPSVSLVLNTFALVGLVALQLFGRADLIPIIDANAGTLATILTSVVSLVYQLYVSRTGHEKVLAGMPVIGTSFSKRGAGEMVVAEINNVYSNA